MKTISEINKAIASIARSGAKLDILIQDTGVSVLEHFAEHKDTGVVNRLYLALPKGARKQAMASWLLAYGALSPNVNKESKAEQPFVFDREKRTDALAAAQDKWYDHKPDKAPDQVFDLQKAIRQVLSKAAKGSTTACLGGKRANSHRLHVCSHRWRLRSPNGGQIGRFGSHHGGTCPSRAQKAQD